MHVGINICRYYTQQIMELVVAKCTLYRTFLYFLDKLNSGEEI